MIEKKNSYLNAKKSLDEIIDQIRAKDIPLEKALDLYEEAIRIGNSCADLIDRADFSYEELEAFDASQEDEAAAEDGGDGETPQDGAEVAEEAAAESDSQPEQPEQPEQDGQDDGTGSEDTPAADRAAEDPGVSDATDPAEEADGGSV